MLPARYDDNDIYISSSSSSSIYHHHHVVVSGIYIYRGVMVIVVGNGHGDTSSNPG